MGRELHELLRIMLEAQIQDSQEIWSWGDSGVTLVAMTLEAKGTENICEEMQYRVGPQNIYVKSLKRMFSQGGRRRGDDGVLFWNKKVYQSGQVPGVKRVPTPKTWRNKMTKSPLGTEIFCNPDGFDLEIATYRVYWYCCLINYHKLSSFKQYSFILQFPWGRNPWLS